MVVTRRGVSSGQRRSERINLGRVQVTIDDLTALFDLLKDVSAPDGGDIVVEFEGGEFDNPDDLRSLSDRELERLTVKNDKIEIFLSGNYAYAIGDAKVVSTVYTAWARARRTRRRAAYSRRHNRSHVVQAAVLGALAVAIGVTTEGKNLWNSITSQNWLAGVGLAFILVAVALQGLYYRPQNYAYIRPLSHDEIRKEQPADRRTKLTIAVAVMSAVLGAAVVIVVNLVVKRSP